MVNLDKLKLNIRKGASIGLNRSLEIVLADILLNAPRKTGKLASSYQITQRATPESLRGEVASGVIYSAVHYPAKPARFVKAPTLFSAPPSPIGQPTDKMKSLINRQVERGISNALG